MSTVGDIMSAVRGYHEYCGGYLECHGGYSVPWGCSVQWGKMFCNLNTSKVLNTLHGTHDIPHMYHDIPHSTEYPHDTQDSR